jgi:hypothetical protein
VASRHQQGKDDATRNPAFRRPGAWRARKAGSMSRPTALVGIVFEERLDFGVVEFVGGHDAVILTLCSVLPL